MLWLHLHKSAGSSIRHIAALNGEVPLQPATTNWNLFLKDRERDGVVNCTERLALFELQEASTWVSVERPFEESADACLSSKTKQFQMGVALRNPIETAESTMSYHDINPEELTEKLKRASELKQRPRDVELARRGNMDRNSPLAHFDNFMVRSLLGRTVFDEVPIGGVSEAHLKRALKSLETRFDVVLVLDDLQKHLQQLAALRNWRNFHDDTFYNAHSDRKVLSNETQKILKKHSSIDTMLYYAARDLANLKTQQAILSQKRNKTECQRRRNLLFEEERSLLPRIDAIHEGALKDCAASMGVEEVLDVDLQEENNCLDDDLASSLKVLGLNSGVNHDELFDHFCGLGYVVAGARSTCNLNALHGTRRGAAEEALRRLRAATESALWSQPGSCFSAENATSANCRLEAWSDTMRSALERVVMSGVEVLLDFSFSEFVETIVQATNHRLIVIHALSSGEENDESTSSVCEPALWWKTSNLYFSPLNSVEGCAKLKENATFLSEVAMPLAKVREPKIIGEIFRRGNTFVRKALLESLDRGSYVPSCGAASPLITDLPWRKAKDLRMIHRKNDTLAHVVVSSVGLGLENDPEKLEGLLLAFEAFTLPSVIRQTTSVPWVIYSRSQLWPRDSAQRLTDLLAPFPHFRLVELEDNGSNDDARRLVAKSLLTSSTKKRSPLLDISADVHLKGAGLEVFDDDIVGITTVVAAGDAIHSDALRETQQVIENNFPCSRSLDICSTSAHEWSPSEHGNYGYVKSIVDDDCFEPGYSRASRLFCPQSSRIEDQVLLPSRVAPLVLPHIHPQRQRISARPRNTSTTDFLRRSFYSLDTTMTVVAVLNALLMNSRTRCDNCRRTNWSPRGAASKLTRLCQTRSILDRRPCQDALQRLGILTILLANNSQPTKPTNIAKADTTKQTMPSPLLQKKKIRHRFNPTSHRHP